MSQLDISLNRIKDKAKKFFLEIDPKVFDFNQNHFSFLGKAVRARFSLLFSDSLGIENSKAEKIALWSELIHTASLLHDDCIDGATFRRGELTINAKFGINTAILLGDLIIGKVFGEIYSLSPDIALEFSTTVKKMSEGALIEENSKYKILSFSDYEEMVSLKTSALFRWIALSLVFLSGNRFFKEAADISEAFGLSFQIIDDVLDIEDGINSGKDRFKDIAEGKITMPFILALQDEKIAEFLKQKINELKNSNVKDLAIVYEMIKFIKENGYIEKSREKAKKLIENIEPLVLKLPEKKQAKEFYNYIYSLTYRRI